MPFLSSSKHHTGSGQTLDIVSAIFAGFHNPVIVKDENSRFVFLNTAACALLGCKPDDIAGRSDRDFLPKEEADEIIAVDREILRTGRERIFEETITTPRGERRTLVTHKHCVTLPASAAPLRLVVAVINDVTELRNVERALRAREEHYRSLIELHPQVPWVATPDGEVEEVGRTWLEISGRAPEDAFGSGWATIIHPDDLPQVQRRWSASIRTGTKFDVECRIRSATGAFRWVRNRAAPRRDEDGAITRWYGLLEDIDERKKAEEAVRESEARFRLIADSTPVMIWMTDAKGETTYLNRRWSETTGQSSDEALGSGWLNAIHPEDRDSVMAAFVEAVQNRAPTRVEYRLRRRDGTWAWVIDLGEPRLTSNGDLIGFAGSVLDISERHAAELALEESETFIRSIFDSSPDCIRLMDLEGNLVLMNRAGRQLFGLAPDAPLNEMRWDKIVAASDMSKVASAFDRVKAAETARFETVIAAHDGKTHCMDVIAAPVFGSGGKPVRILTIWRDVTEAKTARTEAEDARHAAETAARRLSSVLESTMDCVIVLDREWRLTYMNSKAMSLLDLGEEAIGKNIWTLYPAEADSIFALHYRQALAENEAVTFEEYSPSLSLWLEVHASPSADGLSVFFRDISDRRKAEQERVQAQSQILHMSRHDALTGLPNRLCFRERLIRELEGLQQGKGVALLALDLDGFKAVNDAYGHPVGDALLRQVADRLRSCVEEAGVVARVGGDEFVVVQPSIGNLDDPRLLAGRIIKMLETPFDLDGVSATIGTSVGIALGPEHASTVEELVRASDVALYRAKADGRGKFSFFEPGMDKHLQARQQLKLQLSNALIRGELEVHYQPLVELASKKITSCEALVRWRHPEKGMISPADFIPVAEESGLIVQLGAWVLNEACRQATAWPADVGVSVNLSPLQFKSGDLPETVSRSLEASGLAPTRLQLEITESVMLDDEENNLRTLQQIRRLGVTIAMDDFGTGYSSLGYLRSFPFDKIKVDRGFINDLPEGRESLAIIRAVAGIGRSLGITTTVEGVETKAQLDAVSAEGFNEAQGYLFSRPVPASEVSKLLKRS